MKERIVVNVRECGKAWCVVWWKESEILTRRTVYTEKVCRTKEDAITEAKRFMRMLQNQDEIWSYEVVPSPELQKEIAKGEHD